MATQRYSLIRIDGPDGPEFFRNRPGADARAKVLRESGLKIPERLRTEPVPSVTTVLKYSGDKGGLMNWYFQSGKEAARLELEENHRPINSVWDLPKNAAEIGTVAHAMIEADLHGVEFARDMYSPELLAAADAAFVSWQRFKATRR